MKALFLSMLAAVITFSCSTPQQGRIKGEEEDSLVGNRTAGAATYNQLVGDTTAKLLETHRKRLDARGRKLICFVGIENKSAEELAENKDALYEEIDTIIVNSGVYASVSRRYVDSALRVTGLRPDELFLAGGREKFLGVLGEQGFAPDYLLWGKITSLSTSGVEVSEREYLLTMEMVDAHTGLTDAKETSKVRKEYTG
jgi:hypothetical protein